MIPIPDGKYESFNRKGTNYTMMIRRQLPDDEDYFFHHVQPGDRIMVNKNGIISGENVLTWDDQQYEPSSPTKIRSGFSDVDKPPIP